MNKTTFISLLVDSYYGYTQLGVGLRSALGIKCEAGCDNGFITCNVYQTDVKKTVAWINANVDNITELVVHIEMADAYEYRRKYWSHTPTKLLSDDINEKFM